MKNPLIMETVAEVVAKALPKPNLRHDMESNGIVNYTLVTSYPLVAMDGDKEVMAYLPRIYLGAYLETSHPRIWVEELGCWEKGGGWGSFHTIGGTSDYFPISNMPAIAYLGFFGETYDMHVMMTELARKIALNEVQP